MNLEARTLAALLLDAYAARKEAQRTTTRSTRDARDLGAIAGRFDGLVLLAEQTCHAPGTRIEGLIRQYDVILTNRISAFVEYGKTMTEDQVRADTADELAQELTDLADRTVCGSRVIWRDEDVAMARKDLAPYTCRRQPGHTGTCEMHPYAAAIRDQGGVPMSEDYAIVVPANA